MKYNRVFTKCISGVAALAGTVLSLSGQAVVSPAAPNLYEMLPDGNIAPTIANPKHPEYAQQQIKFRAATEIRKEYSVAIWGGANLYQMADDCKIGEVHTSLKSGLGFAAGFKVGRNWNFENDGKNIVVYGKETGVTFMPSIEGEFIYAGNQGAKDQLNVSGNLSIDDTDYSVDGRIYQKFDMDIYAFMVNPILRVQWGAFRPYVGFGVGGAYVDAQGKGIYAEGTITGSDGTNISGGGRLPNQGNKDQSTFAFAFQGLAGTDFFLNKEWSLFVEYKFLGLVGLKFDAGGGNKYDMGDVYGNHLVALGVKYHY